MRVDVSVVMIVKNGARFIAQALASIADGTVSPREIVVVDGGSTDASAKIARGFESVRIVRQKSSGIADAYNEGIAHANGNIIAFLSADDLWLPHKLVRHLALFAERPELLATVSLVEHFLEPGCAAPPGFRPALLEEERPGFLMEAFVARRRVFDAVGLFDSRYSTGEDTDWFARARDASVEIALVPEVLVRKRVHDANASLTDPAQGRNLLRVLHSSIARKRAKAVGA